MDGLVAVTTPTGDTVGVWPLGPPPARHFQLNAQSASIQIVSTQAELVGWSVIEPTGAAAVVALLLNGQGADADVVGAIGLAASGNSNHSMSAAGVDCPTGIYLQIVSGQLTGAIHFRNAMNG